MRFDAEVGHDAGPPAPPTVCTDECLTAGNGRCEDAYFGGAICIGDGCPPEDVPALSSLCQYGTDCSDCGPRRAWPGIYASGRDCPDSQICESGTCVGALRGPWDTIPFCRGGAGPGRCSVQGRCVPSPSEACADLCARLDACPAAVEMFAAAEHVPVPADFVLLPGGLHSMGVSRELLAESFRQAGSHEVLLTRAFHLSRYEVTRAEYRALMGGDPSSVPSCGDQCPVDNLTFYSMLAFANRMSERDGLRPCYALPSDCTGDAALGTLVCMATGPDLLAARYRTPYACEGYRLPTEAEWEIAFRAGTITRYPCGDDPSCIAAVSNSGPGSVVQPIAQLAPNAWGFFDMSGNVAERVWDEDGVFQGGLMIDPVRPDELGWTGSLSLVVRGSRANDPHVWSDPYEPERSAYRGSTPAEYPFYGIGFRLARTAPAWIDGADCVASCRAIYGVGAVSLQADAVYACDECVTTSGECAATGSCCTGICAGAQMCAAGECARSIGRCLDECLGEGSACGSSADCCSGACDDDRRCAGCLEPFTPCETSGQCCTGVCRETSPGMRVCASCIGDGYPCGAGDECCSGVCTDGTCEPPCVPSCAGAECGSDGCGGTCGPACASGVCFDGRCCEPSCDDRTCGADGCGGLCGRCSSGEGCMGGECVACNCEDRECGPDSCNSPFVADCGSCPSGEICSSGRCIAPCNCDGRICGPDSCGTGSCGTCGVGVVCSGGRCLTGGGGGGGSSTCPALHSCLRVDRWLTGAAYCRTTGLGESDVLPVLENTCTRDIQCNICGRWGTTYRECHEWTFGAGRSLGGWASPFTWCDADGIGWQCTDADAPSTCLDGWP